jgi:hypothetical protein
MKKALILFIVLTTINYFAAAQTKPGVKTDTTKVKTTPKPGVTVDTLKNVRFPLQLLTNKFDKIDSADLKLTAAIPIEKYGFVDTADLKMTSCDFEKDANAMVLFDRAEMVLSIPEIVLERQKRIKIFNDNGKDEANIKIEVNNKFGAEHIEGLEAETITLNNGKIEYTKLDPKLVYLENVDRSKSTVVFSMPNVKAGSIIEYRYTMGKDFHGNFPAWDFQSDLPTRYSQLDAFINPMLTFTVFHRNDHPFVRDTVSIAGFGHVWALADISSAKEEPYMRSAADNLQNLTFIISAVKYNGITTQISKSWADVGKEIAEDKDFYKPYDQSLKDEDDLLKHAKLLTTNDQKIAYLFNQVKTLMKWNEEKEWLPRDGIKAAWKKRSGTWGEINMILCRLLRETGINAYPMLVSSRDNGKIVPGFVNFYQINKLVAYVPVDTSRYYVLDASDKYNVYNEVPFDLLNSYGLYLNKEKQDYALVFMKRDAPVKQVVFITADISPDGTMKGNAAINSFGYNKSISLELNKTLDEKKYKEFLTDGDNNLRITSLKTENADVDSLPLTQNIEFTLDLPGTDDKYIYFNPNLFTSLHTNPFINKERSSDIDFGCNNLYSINGRYKIPVGYQVDALPKSMNLVIGDRSITFRRLVGEDSGYIVVNYVISYKKSLYPQANYPDIYAYFKKMNEILNEQIVLKKSE